MRLYGSVNIVEVQDNSNQISGSVNIGIPVTMESDLSGGSKLIGAASNIIVKIDIIPDEIKQALLQAGVKFS